MPITIRCSDCGKALKVKDESAGKKVKCPGCGSVISVPRASDEVPARVTRKPLKPTPPRDDEDEDMPPPPPRRPAPPRHDEDDENGLPPPRGKRTASLREDDDAPPRRRPAPKKESAAMKVLQGILGVLILGGVGFAVWWFFLRGGGGASAGWRDFTVAEGNFKVQMPGEPKQETKTLNTPHGAITQKLYKVEFPKRREVYMASFVDYPPQMVSDGADNIINSELGLLFNMPKRLKSKGKRDAGPLKGDMRYGEVTIATQDEGTLRARAIMVKQRMFILMMNTPGDDSYEEVAKKFYDSFTIVGDVPDLSKVKKDDEDKDKDKDKGKGGDDKDKDSTDKDKVKGKEVVKKEGPKGGGTDFKGHTADITAMALSRKEDRLATVSEHDATLRIWDFPSGKELQFVELKDEFRTPNSVAFSPDGQMVAVGLGGPGEKMILYDLASKKELNRFKVDRSATFLGFSADGKHLIHVNQERAYRFDPNNPDKGEELGQARRGVLSPDGKHLYVSRGDDFRVIDLATKKPIKTPEMKLQNVNALAISADGKVVAIAARDGVHFWNTDAQAPLPGKELKVPIHVDSLALSETGGALVVRGNRQWQAYSLPEGMLLKAGKAEAANERVLFTQDVRVLLNDRATIQIESLRKE